MTSIDLVREFHQRFEQADAAEPMLDNEATNELRLKLIREETKELEDAIAARDLVAVLDALTDLQYVLDGAYLQLGFARFKEAALAEVHRSNLSKLGPDGKPVVRADGKIQKGPGYTPPDLAKVMRDVDAGPGWDSPIPCPKCDEHIACAAATAEAVGKRVMRFLSCECGARIQVSKVWYWERWYRIAWQIGELDPVITDGIEDERGEYYTRLNAWLREAR